MEKPEEKLRSLRSKYNKKTSSSLSSQNNDDIPKNLDIKSNMENKPDSEDKKTPEIIIEDPQTTPRYMEKNSNEDEMIILKSKLEERETIIEKQENELKKLYVVLEEKNLKIEHLVADQGKEKEGHELAALRNELNDRAERIEKLLVDLKKSEAEKSTLSTSLENSKKVEKQLELFLTKESAKNKKLQEELEFVIANMNEEREQLCMKFDAFMATASVFTGHLDVHQDYISRALQ